MCGTNNNWFTDSLAGEPLRGHRPRQLISQHRSFLDSKDNEDGFTFHLFFPLSASRMVTKIDFDKWVFWHTCCVSVLIPILFVRPVIYSIPSTFDPLPPSLHSRGHMAASLFVWATSEPPTVPDQLSVQRCIFRTLNSKMLSARFPVW